MKARYFLTIIPKFQLQIHYTLEGTAENVQVIGVPILIILCIYITASSPVSHTYFCPRKENKKQATGETSQNVSYDQDQSIESEMYT